MLDEPFGALDSFTREELWCVMRDLHAAQKVTIILVTHDPGIAKRTPRRIKIVDGLIADDDEMD